MFSVFERSSSPHLTATQSFNKIIRALMWLTDLYTQQETSIQKICAIHIKSFFKKITAHTLSKVLESRIYNRVLVNIRIHIYFFSNIYSVYWIWSSRKSKKVTWSFCLIFSNLPKWNKLYIYIRLYCLLLKTK